LDNFSEEAAERAAIVADWRGPTAMMLMGGNLLPPGRWQWDCGGLLRTELRHAIPTSITLFRS
jgi:hypothetical protein